MIDVKTLKKLGWSDALISEVTRVAKNIEKDIYSGPDILEPPTHQETVAGNSLFVDDTFLNTTQRLIMGECQNPDVSAGHS